MRKHRNTGRGGARAAVLAFALLLTFASRASLADQATPPRIPVHQTRLPNGLTVVLEEDPRTPIVAISLRYGAGSADEPSSARGASLLVLEMMRESSLHVSAGGFDRLLTAAGGVDLWGVTSFDDTRFSATLPSGRLALGLWILSDQMGFFAQRADAPLLEQERRVALSERRQRIANQALGEVPRFLREAVYGSSHPYASSVYGDRGELDTLTLPEVVDPTPAVAEVVPEVPLVPETEPPVVAVVTPPVVVGRRVVPVVACIEVPLLQAASAKPAETRIERTQPIEHSSDDHEGVYGNDGGTTHRTPQPPRRFSPPKRREGQRLACAGRRFDSHWDRSPAWASLKSAHSAMCSRA